MGKAGNNNATSLSKRGRPLEEGKDAAKIFGTLESEGSDFEPEGDEVKKVEKAEEKKKPEPKAKTRRGGKIDGLTVEQHRRAMGDQVKSKLRVLGGTGNYGIAASCHVSMSCSIEVFRSLVVPNATKVTPAQFDSSTPVVLAQVDSTQQIGQIFGVSKIQDGTRMGSWSASKMDILFLLPGEASGQLRAWWTMH